ncbi:DUF3120 domain-containing protein [Aerosakkonema sp. BLCC-F183]|uniref:DUF3120 domain-containing protein n=1 Tax=Aerosakkonema sp. BLCC-F183 TaxID=3342834 RepID=UPI0035B9DF9D
MFNDTLSTLTSVPASVSPAQSGESYAATFRWRIGSKRAWLLFGAASFLVSIPVFAQAPLVRLLPVLSLLLTAGWVGLSFGLMRRRETQIWGDLLLGFSWSWLAGSIYWGWWRWEPLIHLPIEAICLPLALWCAGRNIWKVGSLFYLGSLFGTAVTDIYFYAVDLIPSWRQLMQVDPALATPILQNAIAQVQTPWGIAWAGALAAVLLVAGTLPLRFGQLHWWAFSGAVLSTIFVDSLFWLVASAA